MAFSTLFKRATSFLGLGEQDTLKPPPTEGEMIYSKNNVCAHPPTPLRQDVEHHPGYLTIRCQGDEILGSTLILTWIPNATLKKNPKSIDMQTPSSSPCRSRASPRRSPRHSFSQNVSPRLSFSSEGFLEKHDSIQEVTNSLSYSNITSNCNHKKSNQSISPTTSDLENKDDAQSLDSWTANQNEVVQQNVVNRKESRGNASVQSHADSGIGPDDSIHDSMKMSINSDMSGKMAADYQSMSSDSESPTTESQLQSIVHRENTKRHSLSQNQSRSVSMEMEGDSLVVVTEEVKGNSENGEEVVSEKRRKMKGQGDEESISSESTIPSPVDYQKIYEQLKESIEAKTRELEAQEKSRKNFQEFRQELKLNLQPNLAIDQRNPTPQIITPDISISSHSDASSSTTPTTSNRDPESYPSSPTDSPSRTPLFSKRKSYMEGNAESIAVSHNLTFPENSGVSTPQTPDRQSPREQLCGVFSVDLGQMRSLRLFFNDKDCTCGQLVLASRESQYKILHFHYGGLDKLADVFQEWNFLSKPNIKGADECCPYQQFSVCRPQVSADECHPEEGVYDIVTEDIWRSYMNEDGQIEDHLQLRKAIFFGGLDGGIRHEAWPFLLHYYPFMSTFDEREATRNDMYIEYQNIRKRRECMDETEKEVFWRTIQCTVEKDVVRTDRCNPYFQGDDNPNIEIMRNILLNYAIYNPTMGYSQGMSDLLAPVLAEVQHESDAFWCFVGLMQGTIFVSSPKDNDMDKNLSFLRELLHLMVPSFYLHLQKQRDAMELLFCHRWILLCFKREFSEIDALRMWEACWSHYQTDYFHLFICLAIISVYGDDVIQQNLPADEMLLHFSSLAMHMNGDVILRKARGLLHQFRKLPQIPCSLNGLCEMCGPGMWDSGHVPIVECIGNHGDSSCPFGGHDPFVKKKKELP